MLKYVVGAASLACSSVAQYISLGRYNARPVLPTYSDYIQNASKKLGRGTVKTQNWQNKGLFKQLNADVKAPVLRNSWWKSSSKKRSLSGSPLKGKRALLRVARFGNSAFNPMKNYSHRSLRRPRSHYSPRSWLNPLGMGINSKRTKSRLSSLAGKMSRFNSMSPSFSFSPQKTRMGRISLRRPRFISMERYLSY